jgi:MoaA/NifB/PqqE/SkfB family radical SAM enzyme
MEYSIEPYAKEPLSPAEATCFIEDRLSTPMAELREFPQYIYIETTNYCNARCVMCGIDFDAKDRPKQLMSAALFDKLTDEIACFGADVEKVMLYLDCEPLVDRNLHKRIRQMKEAGIRKTNIATNASLLRKARAVELIEAGLDEIYITIDSLDKEVYESIRRGLDFATVRDNALRFIELRNELNPGLTIRIQAIILNENHTEMDSIRTFWLEYLNANDQVVIQKAHNWGNSIEVMHFGDEDYINNIPCKSLWGTCVIHADGQVGLCTMDASRSVMLGDATVESVEEIWKGDTLASVRRQHLHGKRGEIPVCDGCTHWREEKREISEPE